MSNSAFVQAFFLKTVLLAKNTYSVGTEQSTKQGQQSTHVVCFISNTLKNITDLAERFASEAAVL